MGLVSKEMIADLIINIVNIVVLFLLTKALLYKPVKKYLTARRERLSAAQAEAEAAKQAAEEQKTEYERFLSAGEEEKAALLREAQTQAQAQAREIVAGAEAEARALREKGAADGQLEKEKLLSSAREEIADLALEISAKIMGREVTDADNLAIAKRFFGESEAER